LRYRRGRLIAVGLLLNLGQAGAFSTRVHIAIANDIREGMIAGDGRTVTLRAPITGTTYRVTLAEADARAIVQAPLAFRAGAVGPDNMAFPGMTDPSHALQQRPFLQCEELYKNASNDEERAYALGCFVHGTSDTVAHHFVNYLAGETFTLTPLTTGRKQSFDNVLAHIQAESLFQVAVVTARPERFVQGQLAHTIPTAFVSRTYFDRNSSLYPVFAGRAEATLRAAMAAAPSKSMFAVAGDAMLGPAEHLSLVPVYLAEAQNVRASAKASIEATVRNLQDRTSVDGARLQVSAGPDGKLGTKDDRTACTATCATIYAKYFVSVGLLAPRLDASGNPLPSAFDKLSEKLGDDLRGFVPAYLETVERVSTKFNTPVTAASVNDFDVAPVDLQRMFDPMTQWGRRLSTVDYRTVSQAVVPGWILSIENALQSAGVNVSVPDLLAAFVDPVIAPIRDAITLRVVDDAKTYLDELSRAYRTQSGGLKTSQEQTLKAAAPEGEPRTVLDHVYDSGIYAHAFNLSAATLANHQIVLAADPSNAVSDGPASFDTSYSPSWTQAGLCDYLREAVFPFGLDARALLSFEDGANPGAARFAVLERDSPVECHDGDIGAFSAMPTQQTCRLTTLGPLQASRMGSLSRGFPPSLSEASVACRNILVPGLPGPKQMPTTEAGGGAPGASANADGCGCAQSSPNLSNALVAVVALLGLVLVRRRSV
jgi:hypothetical protein